MFDEISDPMLEDFRESRAFKPIKLPNKKFSRLFFKGGGGGGIEDTEDQKALADIALDRFQRYQDLYVPAENRYIDEVLNYDSASRMEQAGGQATANVQQSFTEGFAGQRQDMAAQGINPTSGASQQALQAYGANSMFAQSDNMNRSEQSIQDAKITGLQNVTAMGQGVAGNAMQGLGDAASYSAEEARRRSDNAFNASSANRYVGGAVLGGAIGYQRYGGGDG